MTAAKVALINRVDQIYEDDISIRLQLIANNDLLNLTRGRGDRAERPLRRGGLLHAVAGHRLLEHDARALRDRPDHRRVELRHRPPRARPAGRRRRQPRRRRPLEQGRRLHRHPDAGRRLLRDRLRGPRDGPPVRRQPPVQRQPAQLLGRQPQRGHVGRARQRLLDHGVRRHLPHRRPAAAQRPVLLAAQPAGDLDLRRRTRRRSTRCRPPRCATSAAATRCRSSPSGPATSRRRRSSRSGRDRRRAERDPARRRRRDRQHGHDRDRRRRRDAHAAARRRRHDRGRRERRATTARSRSHRSRARASFTYTNPIAGPPALGRRHDHARRAGPDRVRQHGDRPHGGRARPLGRRHRRRSPAPASRATTARSTSPRCRRRARSRTRTRPPASPTRAAARRRTARRSRSGSAATTRP